MDAVPGPTVVSAVRTEARPTPALRQDLVSGTDANVISPIANTSPMDLVGGSKVQTTVVQYSASEKIQAQASLDEASRKHISAVVKRWQKEMDTFLVYAGVFAVVLTAFNIESYKLLRPDPSNDAAMAFKQFSQQVNSLSFLISHPFVNATQRVLQLDDNTGNSPPVIQPSIVILNILWFSSLVLSIASASLALTVKQCILEMASGLNGTSHEDARLRQHRYNSLRTWRIPDVVQIVPMLLQIALVLFLAGLVVLLWTLQETVAAVTTVMAGCLILVLGISSTLPIFVSNCPYRSPQTFVIYYILWPFRSGIGSLYYLWRRGLYELSRSERSKKTIEGSANTHQLTKPPFGEFLVPRYERWKTEEHWKVQRSPSLDVSIAVLACSASLDGFSLKHMLIALSSEPDLPLIYSLKQLGLMDNAGSGHLVQLFTKSSPDTLYRLTLAALDQLYGTAPLARGTVAAEAGEDALLQERTESLLQLASIVRQEDSQWNPGVTTLQVMLKVATQTMSEKHASNAWTFVAQAVHIEHRAKFTFEILQNSE
ncbi:hypothetical protein C8Q77DRAFT_1132768 [Trametes polyzona]|nr:hypothetical protein C8Q77DRAFT_1132768 [Trametes polyzona]